uniref:Protein kinase domain-containing protein n=1 Tax=Trichuris muris TaxID=70415 RepID=A0A5S6QHB2_TRIMR
MPVDKEEWVTLESLRRKLSKSHDLTKPGDVIKDRWEIVRTIGSGGFGEVFRGRDRRTNADVAIKIESKENPRGVLKLEIVVIQAFQGSNHCPRFYGCGQWGNALYMVMQLLGPSLGQRRRQMPQKMFTISTSIRSTVQMVSAIQDLHDSGYVHRDIKLSNMALGMSPAQKNTIFLFDFGLARRYVDADGNLRPERDEIGFRGTIRYASLTAHEMQDLSRRDDLWSLFYVCSEMVTGKLPWRNIRDKRVVRRLKEEYSPERLCDALPHEYRMFVSHLRTLRFEDRPNYDFLLNSMHMAMGRLNLAINDPYDWDSLPDP